MATTDPSEADGAPGRSRLRPRLDVRALAVQVLQGGVPFALVVYLGLRSGGYDEVVRGEAGAVACGLVLVGAAAGALPLARMSRGSWTALGLLVALAAWNALAMLWSSSDGRTAVEAARVATLVGVLALTLAVQTRAGLRRAVGGVAAGIVVIGAVALLSRLEPGWFAQPDTPRFVTGSRARLHYPVGYWNALATLVAIGIPVLLALATAARGATVRALAVASVPLLGLVEYLTLSRGGLIATCAGLLVLLAAHPASLRGALVLRGGLAALGFSLLLLLADARQALTDGLETPVALSQGDELLVATVVICAAVGVLAAVLDRRGWELPAWRYRLPRGRAGRIAGAGLAAAVVAVALAAGAVGAAGDAWDDFKDPAVPDATSERFDSASGSGRYQFWSAALAAGSEEPVLGIGPGTYEFRWAREGDIPAYIRDAHSLYFEAFAESGAVGLLLVLAVVASPFWIAGRRLGELADGRRALVSGALGGCAVFAVGAGIDWIWELAVVPVAFLILAGAAVAHAGRPPRAERPDERARGVLAAVAALALAVVAIPTAGAVSLEQSQARARAGDLAGALDAARTAGDIEPWDAAPDLQEALVLERMGELDGAVDAAAEATGKEALNWLNWLTLSRLEVAAGDPDAGVRAHEAARALSQNFRLLPRSER